MIKILLLSFVLTVQTLLGFHAHADARIGGGIFGRYILRSPENFSKAYTDNGLPTPSFAFPGYGGRLFLMFDTGWRFGATATTLILDRQVQDTTEVRQTGAYGGLTAEKIIFENDLYQLVTGGLVGYGSSQLKVTTLTSNSEINEKFFVLEPRFSIEFAVTDYMKAGAFTSFLWLIPVGKESAGSYQRVDNLSANGLSFGIELLFGVF